MAQIFKATPNPKTIAKVKEALPWKVLTHSMILFVLEIEKFQNNSDKAL